MTVLNPNPNGANGTTSDPREQVAWDFYVESIANQRENAYESAIKAGYEESSAKNITLRGWFKERLEKLKRKDMFSNAEKLLAKAISYQHIDDEGRINVPLLAQQIKVSETLVKTLGKNEGYSDKMELDMKGNLVVQISEAIAKKNDTDSQTK